ncbi:uncharacterized protein PG998_012622 [Apiospora kogelbergensis]|uniref:uncharacterized protein n=1 Tax=Apiospora kogelbergensis TaxID=1337665 RepID=UPI003130E88F
MAPSTRSKAAAAAAAGASPTARKSVKPAKPTPSQSAQSKEPSSVDPVKEERYPITRRYIPRISQDARSVVLPSDDGLESEMADGEITILPAPKPKSHRSALDASQEDESQEAQTDALQPATGADDGSSSEPVDLLRELAPDIKRETSELYKYLILLNNADQAEPKLPVLRVKMKAASSALKVNRTIFLRDGELFIDVMRFHRALKDKEDQDFANNAYHTICTSNLVTLLKFLLDKPHDPQRQQEIVDKVASHFPWVFDFSASSEDEDEVARQTNLAFSLRCCYLASRIRQEVSNDPYVLAAQVFCEDKVEWRKAAREAISQGPYKPLISPQIPGLSTEAYKARMRELDSYLSEKKRERTESRMEAAYPVEQLVKDLEVWVEDTCEKLFKPRSPEARSANNMKSTTPEQAHEDHRSGRSSSIMVRQSGGDSEPDSEAGQPIRRIDTTADKSSIADSSDDDSEMGEPVIRKGVEVAYLFDEDDGEDEASVSHSAPAGPALSHAAPISNQQLHENILGLVVEDVVSSSRSNKEAPPSSSLPAHQSRSNPSKRPVSPDEDSDDDPFETNSLLTKNTGRTATNRMNIERRPNKMTRVSESPVAAAPMRRPPPVAVSSGRRAESPDGAESERVSQQGLQPDDIRILSQMARTNNARAREHGPRKPQVRTAWSDEDRLKLIEDIAEYGCSWSVLEKNQRFAVKRNQQQIRDRARNEKVDFLRARQLLPAGFDNVILGRKEKDIVTDLGLNPCRAEDDVEWVNGVKRPTNVKLSEYESA